MPATGYERLLHDCMMGDATLFQRADMVEAGWRVIQPVLDVWRALARPPFPELCGGIVGTRGCRRTHGARRPRVETSRLIE